MNELFFSTYIRLNIKVPKFNKLWKHLINGECIKSIQLLFRRIWDISICMLCHHISDVLKHLKGEYIRCPKCNKCEGCERPKKDQYLSRYISLDKFMDDNSDDDTKRSGWEPTDNTSTENSVLSLMMIDDLINEVSLKYPEAVCCAHSTLRQ